MKKQIKNRQESIDETVDIEGPIEIYDPPIEEPDPTEIED